LIPYFPDPTYGIGSSISASTGTYLVIGMAECGINIRAYFIICLQPSIEFEVEGNVSNEPVYFIIEPDMLNGPVWIILTQRVSLIANGIFKCKTTKVLTAWCNPSTKQRVT